jgi:hypothetical protein
MESKEAARFIFEAKSDKWRPILVEQSIAPAIKVPREEGFYQFSDATLTHCTKMLKIDVHRAVLSTDDSAFATTPAKHRPEPVKKKTLPRRRPAAGVAETVGASSSPPHDDIFRRLQLKGVVCGFDLRKSLAAFRMYEELNVPCSTFLFPGDGIFPKTGMVFAQLLAASKCISIDPLMRKYDVVISRKDEARKRAIASQKNLAVYAMTFERYLAEEQLAPADDVIVLVYIHSHAPLPPVARLRGKRAIVISMPCCSENAFPTEEVEYTLLKQRQERTVECARNTVSAYSIP